MNKLFLVLFVLSLISTTSCDNDDDSPPANPIDQLPFATQVGANTFGCLLDGEPFLPGNGANPLDCVYQFADGGYYFALQANRRNSSNDLIRLGVDMYNLEIFENEIFILQTNVEAMQAVNIFIIHL